MSKTRLLIWIILFLLLTNVATIISGFTYSARRDKNVSELTSIPFNHRVMFFEQQLMLNNEQKEDFMEFNREFNQSARRITNRIENFRYRMIDELAADNYDQSRLNSICREIGDLHYQLKQTTTDYYLKMKRLCNEDQKKKLYEMFRVMADPEGNIKNFGRGQGRQRWKEGMAVPRRINETEN